MTASASFQLHSWGRKVKPSCAGGAAPRVDHFRNVLRGSPTFRAVRVLLLVDALNRDHVQAGGALA
jgi:hypothetical protein